VQGLAMNNLFSVTATIQNNTQIAFAGSISLYVCVIDDGVVSFYEGQNHMSLSLITSDELAKARAMDPISEAAVGKSRVSNGWSGGSFEDFANAFMWPVNHVLKPSLKVLADPANAINTISEAFGAGAEGGAYSAAQSIRRKIYGRK